MLLIQNKMAPLHSLGQDNLNEVQHDILVTWCHWQCHQCNIMFTVPSMSPLPSLGQDKRNVVDKFFGHVTPVVQASTLHVASRIINGTTAFLGSRQSTTFFHFSPLSATWSAEYRLYHVTFRSSCILSSHLLLGLLLLLLPEMVPSRAAFGNLPFCIILPCLYHLRQFTTGDCLHAISRSLLFLILSRCDFPRMCLIMPISVTARLSDWAFVKVQDSLPQSCTGMILVLKTSL